VLVALVAGGVAFLLFGGDGEATELRLRFAPGQTMSYRLTVHDQGSGEAADSGYNTVTTATLGLDVRSVAGGVATTTASVTDVKVAPAALEPSELGSLADQTARFAEDGRQLDSIVVIADESGRFLSLADPVFPFLPPDAVSVGDDWTVDGHQALSVGTGGTTFSGTARLTRLEDEGRTAVVEADVTETWDFVADAQQIGVLGGGAGEETTNTVTWNGTERLHLTSRIDTRNGVVTYTVVRDDYDLTITSGGGDGNDASVHNTGTFRQEAELVRS
jgi:hypothetical protein